MNDKDSFAARYALLSDADIHAVALNVRSLILPAREALKDEMLRRRLSVKQVNWGAKSADAYRPRRKRSSAVGDKAGEHLEIDRGKYAAWIHVSLAFVLEILMFTFILRVIFQSISGFFSGYSTDTIALVAGVLFSYSIFWNRWRCIESYASQYCTGILNISLLYVPIITFAYANYRGIRKLMRK